MLADRITTCLEMHVSLMVLDPDERDTLLAVLEDPPEGNLSELRGVLAREHRERATET